MGRTASAPVAQGPARCGPLAASLPSGSEARDAQVVAAYSEVAATTPTSSSTSSTGSRSTAGCSSGSPTCPRTDRWPTSAVDPATSPPTWRWRAGRHRVRPVPRHGRGGSSTVPRAPFEVGDLTALPPVRVGGHHQLVLARAPRPSRHPGRGRCHGGRAATGRLAGSRAARGHRGRHLDEWFGQPSTSTSRSTRRDAVLAAVAGSRPRDDRVVPPRPGASEVTDRLYVLARRPGGQGPGPSAAEPGSRA